MEENTAGASTTSKLVMVDALLLEVEAGPGEGEEGWFKSAPCGGQSAGGGMKSGPLWAKLLEI